MTAIKINVGIAFVRIRLESDAQNFALRHMKHIHEKSRTIRGMRTLRARLPARSAATPRIITGLACQDRIRPFYAKVFACRRKVTRERHVADPVVFRALRRVKKVPGLTTLPSADRRHQDYHGSPSCGQQWRSGHALQQITGRDGTNLPTPPHRGITIVEAAHGNNGST